MSADKWAMLVNLAAGGKYTPRMHMQAAAYEAHFAAEAKKLEDDLKPKEASECA